MYATERKSKTLLELATGEAGKDEGGRMKRGHFFILHPSAFILFPLSANITPGPNADAV